MTQRYPAGSEWRKWDLHVHVPGTGLSDGYTKKDGQPDWDRAAEIIEASDVAVLGITDYFSVENTLAFIKYFKVKYPDSEKIFLVNVELRLNETVNAGGHSVNLHVLFSDSVPEGRLREYVRKLNTQLTDGYSRQKCCAELARNDLASATVTRADLKNAFTGTFGPNAEPTDYLIYLAPANNDGLRAESGNQRKAHLADEIDKVVHAIYGKDASNAEYYLRTGRFEDKTQRSTPKPVFGGCDAHSFDDLEAWLGKALSAVETRQVITWVKADPTFYGLHQTLVEPGERVSIGDLRPDAKDSYKVIKRVTFKGTDDFPEEIVFSPNLNAIIGSRSSGKSALLAHIAYAIAPDYTIRQQVLATKAKESEMGPAAGLSWRSVESTVCKIEWADGSEAGGNVIYIPQNWLYQLSDNPREVTGKIQPVLKSRYLSYFREHERLLDSLKTTRAGTERATAQWFELADELARINGSMKRIGDKKSIERARDEIQEQIEQIRSQNVLNSEELENYQALVGTIGQKQTRSEEIDAEAESIAQHIVENSSGLFSVVPGSVTVAITVTPDLARMPDNLTATLTGLVSEAGSVLKGKIESALTVFRKEIEIEHADLEQQIRDLESGNRALIEKHKANNALDELVKRKKVQEKSLDKIAKLEVRQATVTESRKAAVHQILAELSNRANVLDSMKEAFRREARQLDQLTFGIEIGFDAATLHALADPFNKRERGTFLKSDENGEQVVDVEKAQSDPSVFMQDLLSQRQKLNLGHVAVDVAKGVLAATPEVRFTAKLDQDRIGGFQRSTMTPGKQALFALTLILGEAQEGWTLLIDQPEDDLDSRSIYSEIVRYLVEQKKQRQIIMVTHNANLVVGADAEEVIVANRHGDDRKNKGRRTFDYLTGSLEHSSPERAAAFDLDRMGIREHVVQILDGGEEAFQKRRDKYKI